jgi:GH24 family phage-related lysozyme (muramidase)
MASTVGEAIKKHRGRQKTSGFNRSRFVKSFEINEGRRLRVYKDTRDIPTIGVGFNLQRKDARQQITDLGHDFDRIMAGTESLTERSADALRDFAVDEAVETARRVVPSFDDLNEDRQIALADMAGNMGGNTLSKFKKMLAAIEANDWKTAAEEAKNSKWYHQVGDRAERNIRLMQTPAPTQVADVAPAQQGVQITENVPFGGGSGGGSLAQAIQAHRSKQAQTQLKAHEDSNPDEAAEIDALSDLTGLTPDAVAADTDNIKKTVRQSMNAEALKSGPATTKMMTDPAFARQAHQDIPSLLDIEDTTANMTFGQLARQFQAEQPVRTEDLGAVGRAARRSELGLSQMGNQFMAEGAAQRAADSQRSFGEIFDDAVSKSGDPSIVFTGGAAAFRYLTSRFTDPEAAQAAAAERLQNVGELSQQIQSIPRSESATRLIENVTAGETTADKIMAAVTDPLGVAALSGEMLIEQAAPLAVAGVAARTAGPAVGGRIAQTAVGATAFGASSGLTERFRSPAEFFADKGIDLTDPVQAMATALDQDILDEAASFGFTRGAIIGSIDAASGGFASIAWGSAIRTALVNAVAQPTMAGAGEALAMEATTGEVDMTDVILEAVGGGLEGMIEVPVIGGQTLFDARRSTKARQQRAELQELHEKVMASPLTARSPDAAAAHVAEAIPATNVYVPVSRLDQVAEEFGVDAAELYDRLDVSEQVSDARLMDGDIQLTPVQFARHIVADPEMFAAVADHVRDNPESMTAAEAEEFVANGIEEILTSIPEPVDIPVDTPPEVADAVAVMNRTENEALEDVPAAALEGRTADDLRPLEDLSPEEALAEVQEGIAEAGQGADTDIRSASAAATLAQEELGLRQLFRTADEAGMSEGQYASYLAAIAKQADGIHKRQQDKILRQRERESSEAIQREREVVREQARETVQSQPVYQAINSLGQRRLDRKAVVEALPLGEAQLGDLPTQNGRRIYSAKNEKDTVHPALVADQFGFADADVLLFAMMDAVPEADAIEALTDREMHLRHEDLLTQHDAIKAARESLHIDRTGQVLALEMNQLREATQQGRLGLSLIRNEARRRFGLLQVKDIQIDRFLSTQRRHAKTAGKLLRQGDRQGAADAKFHQLMNFEFARLAYKQKTAMTRERKHH